MHSRWTQKKGNAARQAIGLFSSAPLDPSLGMP